jgi:hypothetical protein
MGRLVRSIRAVGVAAALAVAGGCGGAVSPTAPTPLSSSPVMAQALAPARVSVAVVDGVVSGRPSVTAVDSFPRAGVLIEALEGEVVTATTTTDENGNYHLALAPGEVRIRGSLAGYMPTVTGPFSIAVGERTVRSFRIEPRFVPPSLPSPSRVTRLVRGRVTDATGHGVATAVITVVDTDAKVGLGTASADATGAFTVSFLAPAERLAIALSVGAPGYPRQQLPLECCLNPEPLFMSVAMPMRVVGVTLRGPSRLAVSEVAPVTASVVFADGSVSSINPILFEARGGVRNSLRGSGTIEGVAVGSGFISWSYHGVAAGLTITITP